MTTTNPTLLAVPIAKDGNKNTIPETQATAGNGLMSQSTGFPPETSLPLGAGGKAPTREDFNGAFNLLSNIAFYAQKGWTFQYDATQDYYKGCVVIDPTDGNRYECIADMVAGTVAPHEDTDNDYWKVFSTGGGVGVGFIMPYAGTGLQEGWLDCDGSAVSRTMYPDLFAAIGTTWGAGDGSTTFNLPRSEDLVLQGASATNPVGTYLSAGLPNIEGTINKIGTGISGGSAGEEIGTGAFSVIKDAKTDATGSANFRASFTFDASKSNPIYGASDTVQPPAACVRFMIKAFDGPTPSSAGIDLTQYAQDLANKLTREQTPAFNKRDIITTSGTYTAPVTGWYKITVKGAGGGGGGAVQDAGGNTSGAGGAEGGTTIAYEYVVVGETATITIGGGGTAGASGGAGGNGGNTTVILNGNTYTGGGGTGGYMIFPGAGGTGTIHGCPGNTGIRNPASVYGGAGGGAGGGYVDSGTNTGTDGVLGGGGAGMGYNNGPGYTTAGAGGDGYVWFEYFAAS